MWLFTPFGFFSIVRKPDEQRLTVRGRTRGDLQRLRQHYLPQAGEPREHAGSDYPWRISCPADDFAAAMQRVVADIDYPNFKDEVALVTGAARARRYAEVWSALYGMDEDLPEPSANGWEGLPWPQTPTAGRPRAFGGVVVDPQGRLLLREVANHFGGYVWSYAKGRPDQGEAPRQTAKREVLEEMGVDARILLPLPGTFGGTTTRNHFFLMTVDPRAVDLGFSSDETAGLRWALPEEARVLLAETTDATGRQRDLNILDAALSCLPAALPLKRPIARREDWRTRPFPARCKTLPFERTFAPEEMALVARGFVPTVQEQRWFVFLEDGVLHFHRSWTGNAAYRIFLEAVPGAPGHWRIARTQASCHPGQAAEMSDEEHLARLQDLVDHLLIGFGEEPAVDGLALAVQGLGGPNYLGRPEVVRNLVEPLLNAMIQMFSHGGGYDAVQAQILAVTTALTDDPAHTRMPWHSREQLGESLVALMNLDAAYCVGERLDFVVSEACAAVMNQARKIWEDFQAEPQAPWDSDGARAFQALGDFVVSALLGTATVQYPGCSLKDFRWPGRADDLKD